MLTARDVSCDEEVCNDILVNVAGEIASKLSHDWEDCGVGAYEFWGAKGNDVNWQPILCTDDVEIIFPIEVEMIPAVVRGEYTGDGCDGEHRGRCKESCRDVSLAFRADLISVTCRNKVGVNRKEYVVRYSIEQM